MDQTQARQRAAQYLALGYVAKAQTLGGWPKPDEEWYVFVQAADRPRGRHRVDPRDPFYEEFDVRVTPARDAWVHQHAVKPDIVCNTCGYDPDTLQALEDHIIEVH